MAIKMVREPSETPNINNIDDIIPFRYAYGNQNGYVKNKGNEISYTIDGSNFVVNSGRLVLQGVECDIDASGVTLTIDNVATTRFFVVYLQVNLATNTVSILSTYDTAGYPTISTGDDLTQYTSGTARLPIYKFEATSGVISNVVKLVGEIEYINKSTKVDNAYNADNSDNADKISNVDLSAGSIAQFGDYVISKKRTIFGGSSGIYSYTFTDSVPRKIEVEYGVNENNMEIRYIDTIIIPNYTYTGSPIGTFTTAFVHNAWGTYGSATYGNKLFIGVFKFAYNLATKQLELTTHTIDSSGIDTTETNPRPAIYKISEIID